jgi:SAM-dependent methyltransferase
VRSIEAEHAWLSVSAQEKAESVVRLTEGLEVSTIVEIGCGTGALLIELDRLDYGRAYFGIEPSADLAAFFTARKPARVELVDPCLLSESSLRARHFDLAILSHVVEHVPAPAALIAETSDLADHVVLEVPLEGSATANLRASIAGAMTKQPRHNNPAGHVQFFSQADVRRLIGWAGCEIVRERLYVPATSSVASGLSRVVGPTLCARLHYGHFAVLIRRRREIPADERTLWPPSFHADQ